MTINYGRNKLNIARHEAGHAVIARALNINIKYATLEDVNGYPMVLAESAAHQRPSDPDALEHDAIVSLAGPLAQQRHRPLSQSEQDRAWKDGGEWYDDRLNAQNYLLMLQKLRRGEPVVEGQVDLEGERFQEFVDLFNCYARQGACARRSALASDLPRCQGADERPGAEPGRGRRADRRHRVTLAR